MNVGYSIDCMCMNSEKYEEKTIKTSKKTAHMSTAVEGLGDEGILNLQNCY